MVSKQKSESKTFTWSRIRKTENGGKTNAATCNRSDFSRRSGAVFGIIRKASWFSRFIPDSVQLHPDAKFCRYELSPLKIQTFWLKLILCERFYDYECWNVHPDIWRWHDTSFHCILMYLYIFIVIYFSLNILWWWYAIRQLEIKDKENCVFFRIFSDKVSIYQVPLGLGNWKCMWIM